MKTCKQDSRHEEEKKGVKALLVSQKTKKAEQTRLTVYLLSFTNHIYSITARRLTFVLLECGLFGREKLTILPFSMAKYLTAPLP